METINRFNVWTIINRILMNQRIRLPSIDDKIEKIMIKRLASSNIIRSNKPATSKSKQAHIALTGEERLMFYTAEEIESAQKQHKSKDYAPIKCRVSSENIYRMVQAEYDDNVLEMKFIDTHTHKKIEIRNQGDAQVQISKTRSDGEEFIELRKAMYENDILVVIKTSNDWLFIGIKDNWLPEEISLPRGIITDPVVSRDKEDKINKIEETSVKEGDEEDLEDEIDDSVLDTQYQQQINEILINEGSMSMSDDTLPEKSPGINGTSKSNRGKADPRKAAEVIAAAGFKCFFHDDGHEHRSFITEDGHKYYEAHHFIPLSEQRNYPMKLDKKANIVCLCVFCHKMIHHARAVDRKRMIQQIYNERKNELTQCAIIYDLDEIFRIYGV